MKIRTTIHTLLFLTTAFLQITLAQNPCLPATEETNLDANNVNATITNGTNIWNGKYIVPKPDPASGLPEVSAIASGGIWIGGFDEAGNIKVAASTFGMNAGEVDFYPGPLTEIGQTELTTCSNFDYIWSTNVDDIISHSADWYDNGTIDGPIPSSILEWPGRANPAFSAIFGFDLPNTEQELAPFYDHNYDGIYNPYDGDYPDINGADQAHWTLFNDAGDEHFVTGGNFIRIEIQLLAYSFESDEAALNNTTFYEYKFINRAIETIDSTVVGIWIDPALGCPTDDYIGCFPEDNLAFIYNQDAVDGENDCSCPGDINTYCEEIPVVGIKIVRGPKVERIINEDGDLEVPPPGSWGDTIIEVKMNTFMVLDEADLPSGNNLDVQYFRLLTGTWADETPLTAGGNGYNPGSTDYTKFAYSGNPSIDTAWSMCAENTIADPRMLIGVGPFRLEPGDSETMTFAVIYAADVAHPCPDLSVLQDIGDVLDGFFGNNFTLSNQSPLYNKSSLSLFPNPMNSQTRLSFINTDEQLKEVQIYDMNGQLMRTYAGLSANSLRMEKGNLRPGMYFYKVTAKDGKTYSGKFVVN